MAGKSAVLTVKILSDSSGAGKGIDQATSKISKLQSGVRKALPAALAIGGGLALLGKKAVSAASELEQAQGAVEAIYGKSAKAVDEYAKTSVDRLGLSEAAYKNYSALVGAALQNAGFSAQKAAGMSDKAMGRAADMAATFGGSTGDAVDAINAAVSRAEFDPLEKYGVSLNKSAINAELAKRGQDKLTGAAKKQAEAQATLDLIYKNTSGAAGQFARESETVAGQQQRAAASFENAAAALGQTLLPVVAAVTEKLAAMARWMTENKTVVLAVAGAFAAFSAVIIGLNAAIKAYQTIATVVNAVTKLWSNSLLILRVRILAMAAAEKIAAATTAAFNAVLKITKIVAKGAWRAMLGPIGLVVAAIAAAVAIVMILWKKFPPFRNAVIAVWNAIKTAAKATWNAIKVAISAVIGWAKGFIKGFGNVVKAIWRAIKSSAKAAWNGIKTIVKAVVNSIKAVLKAYGAVAKTVWNAIKSSAKAAWNGIKTIVKAVVNSIKTALNGLKTAASAVWKAIKSVATSVWNAIKSVVKNTIAAIKSILTSIRSTATSVWSSVKSAATSAFRAILSPVNAVKSAIDRVIAAVKSAIDWIGKIKVPDIGGIVGKLNPFSAVAPAPAGAPAGPSMARTLAAPAGAPTLAGITGRRLGRSSATAGGNIIINVSGTLNDTDSARAVRRVLRNDQRRRNGVSIDRTRQGLVN